MSYGSLISALQNLQAAKRRRDEIVRAFDKYRKQAKKVVDEAEAAKKTIAQQAESINSVFKNDLMRQMLAEKDPTVRAQLMFQIQQYNTSAEAYKAQFEELISDKLHYAQEAYDKVEAEGTIEKKTADDDVEYYKLAYNDAERTHKSTTGMMFGQQQ